MAHKDRALFLCIVLAATIFVSVAKTSAARKELWATAPDIQGIDFWGEAEGLTQSRIRAIV